MSSVLPAGSDALGEVSVDVKELTNFDYCDRCLARAKARAHRDELELYFCKHHVEEHFDALTDDGWYIYYPS